MLNIYYFASIAEAAGTAQESIEFTPTMSVADLKAVLSQRHDEEFSRLLLICAVLVDSVNCEDETTLKDGQRIDLLPPFAGG